MGHPLGTGSQFFIGTLGREPVDFCLCRTYSKNWEQPYDRRSNCSQPAQFENGCTGENRNNENMVDCDPFTGCFTADNLKFDKAQQATGQGYAGDTSEINHWL